MTRLPILAALLLASAAAAQTIPGPIAAAVADPARPEKQRATDSYRKPAETLAFSGVKPGMIVGEFYPGTGYFTRLLSDVVGAKGHVYGIENQKWQGPVPVDKALGHPNVTVEALPMGTVKFPKPLDLAWVTQNYHDLKIKQYGDVDTVAFDRAVFAALKPGGTYMIVDHEAPAGTSDADIAKIHRIERTKVISEVTAAGFKLVDEGNFLRRSDDDHTIQVEDKRIQGKTDQYALKFMKPR